MAIAMDKCTTRVRVKDAHGDDGKATTIKEREKENTPSIYGDVPHWCAHPRPGDARSRSLFAPFSTTRLSIKQYSSLGFDLLSLSFR